MNFDRAHYKPFWLQSLFRILRYTHLCISNKKTLFYPPQEMELISDLCSRVIAGRRVITLGDSMGGYAAIKYSRAFAASAVVAVSPHWSINPADVENYDPRLTKHFSHSLQNGTKITQGDCAGQLFILYDSLDKYETAHTERILSNYDGFAVPSPFTDHFTMRLLAETTALYRIGKIAAEERLDRSGIRRIIREAREEGVVYLHKKVGFLLRRSAQRPDAMRFLSETLSPPFQGDTLMGVHRACFNFVRGSRQSAHEELDRLSDEELIEHNINEILELFAKVNYTTGLRRLLPLVRQKYPDNSEYRSRAALGMTELGMSEEARIELRHLSALPDAMENAGAFVIALLRLGDEATAYAITLQKLQQLRGHPDYVDALCSLIREFVNAGHLQHGADILKLHAPIVMASEPDQPTRQRENLYKLIPAFECIGDNDGAADIWRRILSLDPDDYIARARLAILLLNRSVAEFIQSLSHKPERPASAEYWSLAGHLWLRFGDKQAAIEAIRTGLQIGGGQELVYRQQLAYLLAETGQRDEASAEIRRLMSSDIWPNDPNYIRSLVALAEHYGDQELALQLAEEQRRVDPLDAASIIFLAVRRGATEDGISQARTMLTNLIDRMKAGYAPRGDRFAPHRTMQVLCDELAERAPLLAAEASAIAQLSPK